ncbi:hypothetical protein VPH35_070389 [Triticum aestivum]|uniref:uncharacterized protein n=1 Tax=Triticum aestivum TaxID=4565 RepID=UPI001D033F63|nr:uncharacterized protein LOC123088535 [Triticum aestivum]
MDVGDAIISSGFHASVYMGSGFQRCFYDKELPQDPLLRAEAIRTERSPLKPRAHMQAAAPLPPAVRVSPWLTPSRCDLHQHHGRSAASRAYECVDGRDSRLHVSPPSSDLIDRTISPSLQATSIRGACMHQRRKAKPQASTTIQPGHPCASSARAKREGHAPGEIPGATTRTPGGCHELDLICIEDRRQLQPRDSIDSEACTFRAASPRHARPAPTALIDRISSRQLRLRAYTDRSYIDFFCSGLLQQRSAPSQIPNHAHGGRLYTTDPACNYVGYTDLDPSLHQPCVCIDRTSRCTTMPGYEPTYFFTASTPVASRDTSKRRIIVDAPLRRRGRHFIAKVFINVDFTNIFINTPPPPCPQDGHLASSDRIFCKTRPRRRQRPRHNDGIDRVIHDGTTASTRRHYSDDPTRSHGSGKTDVCSMGFLRSWQNRWTHHRWHPLTSTRCIIHVCSSVIALFFCASGSVRLHHPRRLHHRPRLHRPRLHHHDRLHRHQH